MRELADCDFDRLRTGASVVLSDDGGPIRTIVTGTKRIWTGRYASVKTWRGQPWESEDVELPLMWAAEVDTACAWWLAQPFRLEMRHGPHRLVYVPDQVRTGYEAGRLRVVVYECKRDEAEIGRDPDYAVKIELATEVFRGLGWRFEVVDVASLGSRRRRANVHLIQLDRRTVVDARDVAAACEHIAARDGSAPYGSLCELLGGYVRGKKALHALMVRRVVDIPLDRCITCDTPVAPVDRSCEPPGQTDLHALLTGAAR